ncbi:polysaccharide deacetylase family protein [Caballeronia insecticola]|uniref:polysaccharide deacetylase n=1 Tax=Caballeronia insecticola TaxID=758793 RepID=UPI001E43B5B9|nr:polysaccharide deacetylase [Caballeronia insecticola]
MLTVDTEALPKRAEADHVRRLIWGQHATGTAGVREMCSIGAEFNVRHTFFVDMCATTRYPDDMREVVRWLDAAGQDVQLHLHPETLPKSFWSEHGLDAAPAYINEYVGEDRAVFLLKHFGGQLREVTGKRVMACRAGSFRWNGDFIRALKTADIPFSFNNSMRAYEAGRSTFGLPTNRPYAWSNDVVEVPVTEKWIAPAADRPARWASLTYPESSYFPFQTRRFRALPSFLSPGPGFAVLLLHSWSFLHWNEKRHATYVDEQRLEGYRRLLARVSLDYDVITSTELADLHARGKFRVQPSVDLARADSMKTT